MERNLQQIDEMFKKAFLRYEDEPGEHVLDQVLAKVAGVGKAHKEFSAWKRVAALLVLLCSSLLTYDVKTKAVLVLPQKLMVQQEPVVIEKMTRKKPVPVNCRIDLEPLQLVGVREVKIPDSLYGKEFVALQTMPVKTVQGFKHRLSATIFAGNEWAEYKLDNDEISSRERHEPSVSVGVMIHKKLTQFLGIKTGLVYSHTAITVAPQEMYAVLKSDGAIAYKYITSSGYGYIKTGRTDPLPGDSIKTSTAQHSLHILSVPLMLTCQFVKRKLSVSPGVGISANLIVASNVKTELVNAADIESVTINKLEGRYAFFAGLITDINIQYDFNNRWGINLIPSFKYALTPITKDRAAKTYPYSYNIAGGLTYKF